MITTSVIFPLLLFAVLLIKLYIFSSSSSSCSSLSPANISIFTFYTYITSRKVLKRHGEKRERLPFGVAKGQTRGNRNPDIVRPKLEE
ncbi:Uncharacterized protein APZ42_028429 [Daphnia magna]|uniref:Secreted protein n=1 Tax=Daphnia magna TaxID=35525 RepID=A0A164QIR8_9CRUS|nr:Uncharacterized protein APZ42_028429 [Daphnia magna]